MIDSLFALFLPLRDESQLEIDRIRAAYHALQSLEMYVDFKFFDGRGKSSPGEARVEFKSGNKLRVGIRGMPSGAMLVICDGSKIVSVAQSGKSKTSRYSAESLSRNLPLNVETFCLFDSDRELSSKPGCGLEGSKLSLQKDVAWSNRKWTVLHETNTIERITCDYFIDPTTHLIWRTYGIDTRTQKPFTDTKVDKLAVNVDLPDTRFKIPTEKPKQSW